MKKALAAKLDTLQLGPNQVVVVRAEDTDEALDLQGAFDGIAHMIEMPVLIMSPGVEIETLDAAQMRKAGWQRVRGKDEAG